MDRFNALQVFVKVADSGGFSSAARSLGMSPPSVTRAIAMLEERLGTRLFIRTTRSVRLTDSGERFLRDSRRILLDLADAENAAVGLHAEPAGEIRITAPVLFGRMFITPALNDFLDLYPKVKAHTLFVDRIVNLMDEGLDIAIRIGNLPDSSLIAIRAGSIRPVMVTSQTYTGHHGTPDHPDDLVNHQLVLSMAGSGSIGGVTEWSFQSNGKIFPVRINPRVRMNTNDAVIELVRRGQGISRLLSYQVAPFLAEGQLLSVLTDYELPPLPVHVVHLEGRMVTAKVRSFVDFIVERLQADPALNQLN